MVKINIARCPPRKRRFLWWAWESSTCRMELTGKINSPMHGYAGLQCVVYYRCAKCGHGETSQSWD